MLRSLTLFVILLISYSATAQRGFHKKDKTDYTPFPYVRNCATEEGVKERYLCSQDYYMSRLYDQMGRRVNNLAETYSGEVLELELDVLEDGTIGELRLLSGGANQELITNLMDAHALISDDFVWTIDTTIEPVIHTTTMMPLHMDNGTRYSSMNKKMLVRMFCKQSRKYQQIYTTSKEVEDWFTTVINVNKYCDLKKREKYYVDEFFCEWTPAHDSDVHGDSSYFSSDEVAKMGRWIAGHTGAGIMELTIIPRSERRKERTYYLHMNY